MPRRVSSRCVRSNTFYTYEEAALVTGVSVQTVRAWRKQGLEVMTAKIPHGIMGFVLKRFLEKRRKQKSVSLALDEFRCPRCKAPRNALGKMADYRAFGSNRGALSTLCTECETTCTKFVSAKQLPEISELIDVAFPNGTGT